MFAAQRTFKDHPVSWLAAYRSMSAATKVLLAIVFLLLLYIVLQVPASTGSSSESEGRQVEQPLREESAPSGDALRELGRLRTENTRLREEVRISKELRGTGGGARLQHLAQPSLLGSLDYDALRLEPNSTSRRFWVKTATNEEGHHFYRRILTENGWIETSNPRHQDCVFQFYGRFVPNLNMEFDVFEEGRNLINHIPGEFAVLNKEPFLHYMRNHTRDKSRCDYTQMHPESYLVHEQTDCEDLFRVHAPPSNPYIKKETFAERDQTYWFWKPPFNSFGRGIRISPLHQLRENFGVGKGVVDSPNAPQLIKERCAEIHQNLTQRDNKKHKLLVQRAVHNPFLIKGSKFDFRAYIFIANARPYIVYAKFGHVRRCLRPYSLDSKVKKAHVCNDYSDELEQPGFPLNEEHIWDREVFKQHMLSAGYTENEFEQAFSDGLKRLFLSVFKSFKDYLPQKQGYWLLLGLDIAINENWNMWVLEVNTNPSVHYDTRVWGELVTRRNWLMLNEAVELVYGYHIKFQHAPRGADGSPMLQTKDLVMRTKHGFELIYSEAVSPPYQYSNERCFVQKPIITRQLA